MRRLALTFLAVFIISPNALSEEINVSIDNIKSSLSRTRIFSGPDSTHVTRSALGPNLYKMSLRSTVLVMVFEYPEGSKPKLVGQGSGVVISETGKVITNWHVTWPQDYVLVIFHPGLNKTYDDISIKDAWMGHVLKVDQTRDLALLKIEMSSINGNQIPVGFKPILIEDPASVSVGQDVFAIGHPEGLHWTYTEGVISQIRPRHPWEASGNKFRATIVQTQTAVSYGSSGGPLINKEGRLVGIISSMIGERSGFNFAIAAHELKDFALQ